MFKLGQAFFAIFLDNRPEIGKNIFDFFSAFSVLFFVIQIKFVLGIRSPVFHCTLSGTFLNGFKSPNDFSVTSI